MLDRAMELKLVLLKHLLKFGNELSAEDAAQCADGQKAASAAEDGSQMPPCGPHPTRTIRPWNSPRRSARRASSLVQTPF